MIRNTSVDRELNDLLILADGMSGGDGTRVITAMEKQGQAQLVESTQLPSKMKPSQEAFEEVGFTFGEVVKGDELFCAATLPEGWRKDYTDHSMHTIIVDQLGRQRVSVFYKAAFYDRRADMILDTHYAYLSRCLWDKTDPVLDDVWLTAQAAVDELETMHAKVLERQAEAADLVKRPDLDSNYWTERVAEYGKEAAGIKALAEKIAANNG